MSPQLRVVDLHCEVQRRRALESVDRVDIAVIVREDVLEHVGVAERRAVVIPNCQILPMGDMGEHILTRSEGLE